MLLTFLDVDESGAETRHSDIWNVGLYDDTVENIDWEKPIEDWEIPGDDKNTEKIINILNRIKKITGFETSLGFQLNIFI